MSTVSPWLFVGVWADWVDDVPLAAYRMCDGVSDGIQPTRETLIATLIIPPSGDVVVPTTSPPTTTPSQTPTSSSPILPLPSTQTPPPATSTLTTPQIIGIFIGAGAAVLLGLIAILIARHVRHREFNMDSKFLPGRLSTMFGGPGPRTSFRLKSPVAGGMYPATTFRTGGGGIGLAVTEPKGTSTRAEAPARFPMPDTLSPPRGLPRTPSPHGRASMATTPPSSPAHTALSAPPASPAPKPSLTLTIPYSTPKPPNPKPKPTPFLKPPAQTHPRDSITTEFEEDGTQTCLSAPRDWTLSSSTPRAKSVIWRPPSQTPVAAPYYVADRYGNWVLGDPARDPAARELEADGGGRRGDKAQKGGMGASDGGKGRSPVAYPRVPRRGGEVVSPVESPTLGGGYRPYRCSPGGGGGDGEEWRVRLGRESEDQWRLEDHWRYSPVTAPGGVCDEHDANEINDQNNGNTSTPPTTNTPRFGPHGSPAVTGSTHFTQHTRQTPSPTVLSRRRGDAAPAMDVSPARRRHNQHYHQNGNQNQHHQHQQHQNQMQHTSQRQNQHGTSKDSNPTRIRERRPGWEPEVTPTRFGGDLYLSVR